MPLARIITEDAEDALELAIQLRSRGFQVETVAPGQIPATPADLEVELDSCDAQSVLSRVMTFSTDPDSCVFVAPGSLDQLVQQRPHTPPDSEWQPATSRHIERTKEVSAAEATHSDPCRAEAEPTEPVEGTLDFNAPPIEVGVPEVVGQAVAIQAVVAQAVGIQANDDAAPNLSNDVPASAIASSEVIPAAVAAEIKTATVSLEAPIAFDAAPAPENPPPVVRLPDAPARRFSSRPKSDAVFWRVAIPAAALATLVVLAGSVWQGRHPAAGTLPTSASQQIPFQKAPAQTAPAAPIASSSSTTRPTAPDSAPAASTSPVSVAAQPIVTPQAVSPSSGATVPKPVAVVSARSKKAKAQPQHRATTHSHDSGLVARDTVVYFGKKPGDSSGVANSTSK